MSDTPDPRWEEVLRLPTHERLVTIARFGPQPMRLPAATLLVETCLDRDYLLRIIDLFPLRDVSICAGRKILADDEATPAQLAAVMAQVPLLADAVAARLLSLGQPNTILTQVIIHSAAHRDRAWDELLTRPDLYSLMLIQHCRPEYHGAVLEAVLRMDPAIADILLGA